MLAHPDEMKPMEGAALSEPQVEYIGPLYRIIISKRSFAAATGQFRHREQVLGKRIASALCIEPLSPFMEKAMRGIQKSWFCSGHSGRSRRHRIPVIKSIADPNTVRGTDDRRPKGTNLRRIKPKTLVQVIAARYVPECFPYVYLQGP